MHSKIAITMQIRYDPVVEWFMKGMMNEDNHTSEEKSLNNFTGQSYDFSTDNYLRSFVLTRNLAKIYRNSGKFAFCPISVT